MTVSTSTSRSGPYNGAGTTGPFVVGFRFLDRTHLRVVKTSTAGVDTDLVLDTQYSVAGVGAATGSVTLVTALAVGEKLTIVRAVPATQEAEYVQNDAFPAESHENALDKATMLIQQTAEVNSRALRFPVSDTNIPELPAAGARANMLLSFDASGVPVATIPSSQSAAALQTNLADPSDLTHGDAMLAVKQSFTGAVARTQHDKNADVLSLRDFGAIGDGITDDTAALQSALNAAVAYGFRLCGIGGKTYKVTSGLVANGAIDLDLCGDAIDGSAMPVVTTLNAVSVLKVTGSIGASVSATSDVAIGAKTINIASSAGLAAGDYILLSSNQTMVDGFGNAGNLRGELQRIETVPNGTSITINSETLFSYTTAAAVKIQKLTPAIGIKVRNGRIVAGGVGSWHSCLQLHYCVDFEVSNLDAIRGEDVGISTFYAYGGTIHGGRIEESTNPDGGMASDSGTGYGVCLYNATRDVVIDAVEFRRCKRAVTGGSTYPSVFCTTQNCNTEGGRNGFGTHEPCWWWTIQNNTARGMTGVGINIRGQYTRAVGNKLFDCAGFGIQVRTFYVNPTGLNGTQLIDNYMDRTAGIFINGDETDGRVNDTTIVGGEINTAVFNSITVTRADNLIIRGVRMDGQTTPGTTDGNGIILNGSATAGDRITNAIIEGCDIISAARYGIWVDFCDNVQILGNKLGQAQQHGIYAVESTDLVVNSNRVKSGVVNFTYGIRAQNCQRTTVNGNSVQGNNDSGQTGNHGIGFIASSGSCVDNLAVGNTVSGFASAVIVSGAGVDHSVVVGNNGRNCYGGTKFNIASANQSVANNLV